ncbi:MAG: flippase [Thermodesulfobacteriota bacterium]
MMNGLIEKIPFLNKLLDRDMKEVVVNALLAFLLRVSSTGLMFLFNVLLSRLLGAEGVGQYYLALMVTTIATLFGRLGMDTALLRFVAEGASSDDWASVKGAYRKTFLFVLLSSVAAGFAVFLAAPFLAAYVLGKPELTLPLRLMSFAVPPVSLLVLHAEGLKGLKRIGESLMVQFVALSAFSIIGLYFLGRTWGVSGAISAYVAASLLALALGRFLWKRAVPHEPGATIFFETKKLMDSSMPLFWSFLMGVVVTWAPTFMLGIWGTSRDVGIFSMASRTSLLISLVLFSFNAIVAPKFAEFYKKNDIIALGATLKSSARMMSLAALPIVLVFMLAPGFVMSLFGEDFKGGETALRIMSLGQFVNVAAGSVGYMLIMTGNEKANRNNAVLMLFVNISLGIILIPFYGITGAAITTVVSIIAANIGAVYLVYKHLSIKVWERA